MSCRTKLHPEQNRTGQDRTGQPDLPLSLPFPLFPSLPSLSHYMSAWRKKKKKKKKKMRTSKRKRNRSVRHLSHSGQCAYQNMNLILDFIWMITLSLLLPVLSCLSQ
jgi:hypothetical protein